MPDYKALYFHIFGAVADAVEAMDAEDFARAKALLVAAQLDAEEAYLAAGEEALPQEIK